MEPRQYYFDPALLETESDATLRACIDSEQSMFFCSVDEKDVQGAWACWTRACQIVDEIVRRTRARKLQSEDGA